MCSWLLRLVSQIGRTIPSLHRRTRFHPDKTVLSRIRDIETKITQQQQKLDVVHEDLQQLISKLSLITTRDPMTGLENYSCFQSRLAELLRGKEPFALVFLDLDNLKTINTNRGHLAGDEFIIRASHVLYDSIRRKSDRNWLFRRNQAADEFLLILRGADLLEGVQVSTQVLSSLRLEGITASIGVAEWNDIRKITDAALETEANEQMLAAKQHGKNQVFPLLGHFTANILGSCLANARQASGSQTMNAPISHSNRA
jgi:diguanylate cyclase (GGDEF)-like protein